MQSRELDDDGDLDDLFEECRKTIYQNNNLIARESIEPEEDIQHLKGILPQHVDVYDTLDTSTQPLTLLPQGLVDDHKDHAKKIAEREKNAAVNLLLPGKERYMMPAVPNKSKRLRDFENPQFYPFSTLPIEDAERTMQLKQIQKLIKTEKIDEGLSGKDKLGKVKVFERKYDQYFTKEIMSQVLGEALRYDPDVSTSYYERTDQLLLVLHNKINGSKRFSENMDRPHCSKVWRAPIRVMPNFANWISSYQKAFSPVSDFVPKDQFEAQVKYNFDQSAIPESMIDIDYNLIKNIQQNVQQFYPDDNSIIQSEQFEVNGKTFRKSMVFKDKLTFGFAERETSKSSYLPVPEKFGLVSYRQVGTKQFWLNHSDHGTKMHIETVMAERNKQKIVEIKPPEPTPEEIAQKEEERKALIAQLEKEAKKKGQKGPIEIPEEKPPEPVFKEMEPNFLDSLFDDEELG